MWVPFEGPIGPSYNVSPSELGRQIAPIGIPNRERSEPVQDSSKKLTYLLMRAWTGRYAAFCN